MNDRPALEALGEITEALLDPLIKNEFVAAFPFVGSALKFYKAALGAREQLYAKKLLLFLNGLDQIPETERNKLLSEVGSVEDRKRLGERLIMVLDQISDMERPAIMAVYFIAYLRGWIDRLALDRYWDAIANAYHEDLITLLNSELENPHEHRQDLRRSLARAGLSQVRSSPGTEITGTPASYQINDFGLKFIEIYKRVKDE